MNNMNIEQNNKQNQSFIDSNETKQCPFTFNQKTTPNIQNNIVYVVNKKLRITAHHVEDGTQAQGNFANEEYVNKDEISNQSQDEEAGSKYKPAIALGMLGAGVALAWYLNPLLGAIATLAALGYVAYQIYNAKAYVEELNQKAHVQEDILKTIYSVVAKAWSDTNDDILGFISGIQDFFSSSKSQDAHEENKKNDDYIEIEIYQDCGSENQKGNTNNFIKSPSNSLNLF